MSITRVRALRLRRLHLPPLQLLLLDGLGLSTEVTAAARRAAAQVCHLALVPSRHAIHVSCSGNANPSNARDLARQEWGQLALAIGQDLRRPACG